MRFAVKVVPLGVLGCAAALLVACGDSNGLLSGGQSSSLQDALSAVQSACAGGNTGRAEVAANSFRDRVQALPSGVDRSLVANLQDGAATLQRLVAQTCTGTTSTTTTPTTTETTPTTTETTPTTPTTTETTPTTTTTPVPPPPTTPTTTVPPPPQNGGGPPAEGRPGDGNSGGAPGNPGGAAPGQLKKLREGDGQ